MKLVSWLVLTLLALACGVYCGVTDGVSLAVAILCMTILTALLTAVIANRTGAIIGTISIVSAIGTLIVTINVSGDYCLSVQALNNESRDHGG